MVRGRNGGCNKNRRQSWSWLVSLNSHSVAAARCPLKSMLKTVPNLPPRSRSAACDGAGSTSTGSLAAIPNNAWTFSGKRVTSPAGGGASLDSMPTSTVSAWAVAAAAEAIATSASVAGCIKLSTSTRTLSARILTKAHVASYVFALLNCKTEISPTPTQKFTPLHCMRRVMARCPSRLLQLHAIDHEQ